MQTAEPRAREEVFLLGCGRSVLDLTPQEIAYVNRAPCRVALNKFTAFYNVVGIIPTHVWFTEYHDPSYKVLQYIFDVCAKDALQDLTFVMGHRTGRIFASKIRYHAERVYKHLYYRARRRISRRLFPKREPWNFFYVPRKAQRGWRYQFITHTPEIFGPLVWAQSLDEPLFHHRTAFTAGLNYLSVLYPTATIKLVGVDFNVHGYFFDEEMKRRGIHWSDYTSELQADRNQHFAAIPDSVPVRPGTVFDVFPFMRARVLERGGSITCSNRASATISQGLAEYEPVITPDNAAAPALAFRTLR